MVMVGGVLILISFCVALIPYSSEVASLRMFNSKSASHEQWYHRLRHAYWDHFRSMEHFRFIIVPCMYFCGFSAFFMLWLNDPFNWFCSFRSLSMRSMDWFLCYYSWVVVIVLLSFYLLMVMVVSINISSKYSGALVNKNWVGNDRSPKLGVDNLFEMWKSWKVSSSNA
uniref:NADH dehydrogenase subunit 6 n=1 Tax=Dicyathifer mannii TaxID=2795839 RepID=A0A8F5CFB6_9BIVA|nr:NADH dehydrogenase subunit 6 [Dicyathifer mannii]UXF59410.1 NADH dehydrogenase subunit 6 [Dicyathifer mannii]